jgi:hypothetical protein
MDVEAEHCGDQQPPPASPIVVAPVIAVGSPISSTPPSVSFAGKGSPVAAAAAAAATTPGAAERVTTPVQVRQSSHTFIGVGAFTLQTRCTQLQIYVQRAYVCYIVTTADVTGLTVSNSFTLCVTHPG